MRKIVLVIVSIIGAAVLLGIGAAAYGGRGPKELRDRKLDERSTFDLEGLGSVTLPPTFRLTGIVNSGERHWFGGETTSRQYHLDERMISFRFEQGQFNRAGGYKANPVLMDVTLFNGAMSAADMSSITHTTIGIFYSETGKTRLGDVRWDSDSAEAGTTTKSGEVSKALSTDGVPRWLVIHVDPTRRVRIDFHAWQKTYTLAEAKRLVRDVAASVKTTPALQGHFDSIKTFDQRMEARRDSVLSAIAEMLASRGLAGIMAGKATSGPDCVVHLTANRRFLTIARYLGQVPIAAATRKPGQRPVFPFAFTSGEFEGYGSTNGRTNLDIHMFYWDAETAAWRVDGLQTFVAEPFGADEEGATAAILAQLGELGEKPRDAAYLWSFATFDVLFRADEVALDPFLARARAYEEGLAGARIISGVKATKGAFP